MMRLSIFRRRGGRWLREYRRLIDLEPDEFRARLNASLSELSAQIERLKFKFKELEQRGKLYLDRCVEALVMKDEEHALMYANEIAELRKLANIILHSELILEQVKIRLESILELSDVIGLVTSLRGMIGKVAGEVSKIAPEAAMQLEELSKQIDEFVASSGSPEVQAPTTVYELSDEAAKIFEDAKQIVAMKLKESFPDVPVLTDVEQLVYSYISSLNPRSGFDIEECCSQLGLSEEQVESALEGLQKKGIIEISEMEAI